MDNRKLIEPFPECAARKSQLHSPSFPIERLSNRKHHRTSGFERRWRDPRQRGINNRGLQVVIALHFRHNTAPAQRQPVEIGDGEKGKTYVIVRQIGVAGEGGAEAGRCRWLNPDEKENCESNLTFAGSDR